MGGSSSTPVEDDRSASAMLVNNLWTSTWKTVDRKADPKKDIIINTPGWNTVRLYVSSTFEDFALERKALATKVFPELRKWCFERNIYFIDCDLKWGVTRETRTTEHLELCLQEITRCKEENEDCPFLLHMSCSKVGWVPEEEITDDLRQAYGWVDGLSHTEMEVLHAAFRKGSPNAFFAIRKPDFITSMPKDRRPAFVDANEMADNKMMGLRKGLRARFRKDKMLNYTVNYQGQDSDDSVLYGDMEQNFALPVIEHFKKRIETTYPASNQTEECDSRVSHKEVMEETASGVKGWEGIISQLTQHIDGQQSGRLVLLTGGRGTGKSAILTSLTQSLHSQSSEKVIFYYNVAAEPSASPTKLLLCSLLQDLHIQVDETSSLQELCQVAHQALSSTDTPACLLVVDGADQLTDEPSLTWLPRRPPANVCCVLSLDGASVQCTSLHKPSPYSADTDSSLTEIKVPELNDEVKQAVIEVKMAECDLDLGAAEKNTLLQHPGTSNPQWVCIACRELAASGHVTGKRIEQLPADLNSLCVVVLDRLEQEMGRALPVASLCLLYLSTRGLHETELLALLANEEDLVPRRRKGTGEFQKPEVDVTDRLIASRWAALYRALRPYITNYVTSGISRMRIRHTGLGDAIRKRYLTTEDDDESWENHGQDDTEKIKWWKSKLSCFQGDEQ